LFGKLFLRLDYLGFNAQNLILAKFLAKRERDSAKKNFESEYWLGIGRDTRPPNFANIAAADTAHTGDILVISLCNESNPIYHVGAIANPVVGQPTSAYEEDYDIFVGDTFTNLNSFIGINYPISTTGAPYANSKAFIQQTLLAIKGNSYTTTEANAIPVNSTFTSGEWDDVKASLTGSNPYSVLGAGLDNYNWTAKVDKNDLDFGTTGVLISPEDFANDINTLLADIVQVVEVEVEVPYLVNEYNYIEGESITPISANNSWTMSYSLKQSSWISWHSYMPNFYLNVPEKFYSWKYNSGNYLWKHGVEGKYQSFYGTQYPFIIEFVSLSNPIATRIWEYISMLVEVKRYNPEYMDFIDINDVFFNKLIAYNSRQCSGLLNIKVKDANQDSEDYLYEQITNLENDEIIVDRNERNWSINNLRDIRTNYNEPIFFSNLLSLQDEYFIDKVLNNDSIDYDKDWTEMESFRDKYLVIRLIFDNFARNDSEVNGSTKMIMNFSVENETQSFR